MNALVRCPWAGDEPAMVRYHDEEWGVPEHDDHRLFEFLTLEGAQAGLSWRTILLRRDGYRRAFLDWDIDRVAAMGEDDVERLLQDTGIIRNRAKVESAIGNARIARDVIAEWGSLDAYVWRFVDGTPLRNAWRDASEVPASTEVAEAMSKQMRKDGFRFVGPTILYAYMQSMGMVNDHTVDCFRHAELS
ncbi:MAG: DNA-3-methyladenine glycosylase I [Dehalococcoidia bacterium]|nr:DNA-3-methyladenine glycosylase I [Dehalococcoidia bacterium]